MSFVDPDRARLGWWLFGVGLLVGLALVLHSFVGTFVFGVFFYYATRPIYGRIVDHIYPRRFAKSIAAAIAIFALALPALFLALYALFIAVRELDRLTRDAAFDLTQYPGIDRELVDSIADPAALLELDLQRYMTQENMNATLRGLAQATDALAFFGIGLVHLFVMVALAFYLLRDDSRLARRVSRTLGDETGILEEFMYRVDRDFSAIFFGNILNAVLTGTIGIIVYSLLNGFAPSGTSIPVPALVGALAGVASLVPVVGMKLVYVPVALYLAALAVLGGAIESLWFVFVFAGLSFVVVDTIPDLVLRPYVSGRSLHVGSLMIAYTLGPLLFGWYGIFLLPMLLVLAVHFVDLVLPELLAGIPIEPNAVDPGSVMHTPEDVFEHAVGEEPTESVPEGEGGEPVGSDGGSVADEGGVGEGGSGGD